MKIRLQLIAAAFIGYAAAKNDLPEVTQGCSAALSTIAVAMIDPSTANAALMTVAQALDSWGKPSGILRGTFTALGDYNECLDTRWPGVEFNYVVIDGTFSIGPISLGSQLGVCMPKQCQSEEDLKKVLSFAISNLPGGQFQKLFSLARSTMAPSINLFNAYAQIKDDSTGKKPLISYQVNLVHLQYSKPWDAGAVVVMVLISFLFTLVVLSTIWDFRDKCQSQAVDEKSRYTESPAPSTISDITVTEETANLLQRASPPRKSFGRKLLACFSLYNTLTVLFSTKRSPSMKSLAVLDVLRVVSMWWIVSTHTCAQLVMQIPIDLTDILKSLKTVDFVILENAFLGVDTFFFLSAFIASYGLLQNIKYIRTFSYPKYVVMRYLRMTPSYMMVMFFYFYVFPLTGHGPLWYNVYERFSFCSKYWWTHLLYINNIYPARMDEECMPWAWYLAADYQFYLIAPIFIILLGLPKWRRVGVIFTSATIVLQFIWTFTISYVNDIPALASVQSDALNLDAIMAGHNRWMTTFYMQFYNHMNVFLGGVLTAHFCIQFKDWQMKQWMVWSFHAVSAFCLLLAVYVPYDFLQSSTHWSNTGNAFYNYFSRCLWSIGLAAITFPSVVCGETRVRLLNTLFMWGGWRILARLTYGVYLTHCVLINLYHSSYMREIPFSPMSAVIVVAGIALWSYICSAILFVTVEAPVGNFVKLIVK